MVAIPVGAGGAAARAGGKLGIAARAGAAGVGAGVATGAAEVGAGPAVGVATGVAAGPGDAAIRVFWWPNELVWWVLRWCFGFVECVRVSDEPAGWAGAVCAWPPSGASSSTAPNTQHTRFDRKGIITTD